MFDDDDKERDGGEVSEDALGEVLDEETDEDEDFVAGSEDEDEGRGERDWA